MALASLIYPPILFLGLTLWLSILFPPGRPQALEAPSTHQADLQADSTKAVILPAIPLSSGFKPSPVSFLIGAGISAAILIHRYLLEPTSARFGPLANSTIAAQTAEFYERGRVPIFHYFQHPMHLPWPNALFADLLARTPGLSRLIPLLAILLGVWGYQTWLAPKFGKFQIPPLVWRLLVCSFIIYALAWPALFYLYVPERYLQLSMPILYTALLAALLERVWHWLSRTGGQSSIHKLKLAAPLIFCLIIFSRVWDANLMVPDADLIPVLTYLKHSPKATLIAATPGLASDIPAYAQRSVVLSEETYIPFHQSYFQEMKRRLQDFLVAYYSVTPTPLIQWIQRYSIQYILINTEDFAPKRTQKLEKKYYHSFPKNFYTQLTQGHRPNDYLLSHPRSACRVMESGPYILLSGQAILNQNCWVTAQDDEAPR